MIIDKDLLQKEGEIMKNSVCSQKIANKKFNNTFKFLIHVESGKTVSALEEMFSQFMEN